MSLNKREIIHILKEEYEKRINHYINLNEIEIKDKNDNDLISSAKGLKVSDKAGFRYTVEDVIEKDGKIFVRLLGPGEPLEDIKQKSFSRMDEKEENDKEDDKDSTSLKRLDGDIFPPNKKASFKKSNKINIKNPIAMKQYNSDGPYLDVEIDIFEKEFSL